MTQVVVDANVVLRLILPSQQDEEAIALWRDWARQGVGVIGPPLLFVEVTNTIWHMVYAKRVSASDGEAIFANFCNMPVTMVSPEQLHIRVWDYASRYNRPDVRDAHYLALAEMEGCEFWTADRRLVNSLGGSLPWVKLLGEYDNARPL